MLKKIAYRLGTLAANTRHVLAMGAFCAALGLLIVIWPAPTPKQPEQSPENIARDRAQAAADAQRLALCTTGLPQVVTQAQAQLNSGNPSAAYDTMDACQQHLVDGPAKALYFATLAARDAKTLADEQRQAKKEKEFSALVDKAAKAERRRHPPVIGMTMQQAVESAWGRPEHSNTTETARGVRSQWVYGNRRYLYFDNDTLTAIQQ